MFSMRITPVIVSLCVMIMVSCSAAGWSSGYSQYGFYVSPDQTVKDLSDRADSLSACEHFILANAYKEKGDFKKAAIHYANSAFVRERNLTMKPYPGPIFSFLKKYAAKSDYYEDAALELSIIFSFYSEFSYSDRFAALVGKDDISLYREAVLARAKALDSQKKYDEAVKVVREGISAMPKNELKPVLYIRLGSLMKKKNDIDGSVHAYNEAIRIAPEGWQASTAGKELLEISKTGKVPASFDPTLTVRGLLSAKENTDALKLLESIGSAGADQYMIAELKVRTYCANNRTSDADKIISAYDHSGEQYSKLTVVKAETLWQKGSRSEAIKAYESVLNGNFVKDRKNEFRRVCFYLYENNAAETPVYCLKYAELFPDDRNADKMLWLAAKPYIERKDISSARGYLDRIVSRYPNGDYSGNARFWLWKYLTAEGKKGEAEKILIAMPLHSGGSTYTWILLNRLKDNYDAASLEKVFTSALTSEDADRAVFAHAMLYLKNGDENARIDRLKDLTSKKLNPYDTFNADVLSLALISENMAQLKRTEKYFAAGYSEGIARVFNAIVVPDDENQKSIIEKDKAMTLAAFGSRYNHAYSGVNGITGVLEWYRLQENVFLFSHDAGNLVLPQGFSDIVDQASSEFHIEKGMVYSIIKAESAFNHKAVSGAGAVGLMQLMPPTAKDVASKMKLFDYDMKNQVDAIRFGTYYLGWLEKYFKGNFRDMVAGYNAGAGNVNKWHKQYSRDDDDLFVEQVPFEETRGYMLRTEKYIIQYRLQLHK